MFREAGIQIFRRVLPSDSQRGTTLSLTEAAATGVVEREPRSLVTSDLYTTAQERGSLKGLLPVGTPTSRASFPAFCRQYCCSSAAAWDTLILSTLASSFSCSTSRLMLDKLEFDVMSRARREKEKSPRRSHTSSGVQRRAAKRCRRKKASGPVSFQMTSETFPVEEEGPRLGPPPSSSYNESSGEK